MSSTYSVNAAQALVGYLRSDGNIKKGIIKNNSLGLEDRKKKPVQILKLRGH